MDFVNYYSGCVLDRSSELRNNTKYLKDAITKKGSKYIIFQKCMPLFEGESSEKNLVTLSYTDVKSFFNLNLEVDNEVFVEWPSYLLYIGKSKENEDWFAVNNTENEDGLLNNLLTPDHRFFAKGYDQGMLVSWKESAIVSQAQSMFHWHDRYRYCPTCGSSMVAKDAGYKRKCSVETCRSNKGVNNTSYPRTDPTVIMNVVSRDYQKCLLGRSARWPKKMYSCLAGFMEPGESIEDAVNRETKEESGISVENIRYLSSQPWPYPASLMIGCQATATIEEIVVNKEELEDARWFGREVVKQALDGKSEELILPPFELN